MASAEIVNLCLEATKVVGVFKLENREPKQLSIIDFGNHFIIKNGMFSKAQIKTMSKKKQLRHEQEDFLLREVYINHKSYGKLPVYINKRLNEIYNVAVRI